MAACLGSRWLRGVVALAVGAALPAVAMAASLKVKVKAEEEVYSLLPPNNGSGPLWSYGCTPIVRMGKTVVVSQMETGKDVPLLCNTRWRLLRREAGGWKTFAEEDGYRQREPCVLARTSNRDLFLSVNDSQMPAGTHYGRCLPHLLHFSLTAKHTAPPAQILPTWDGPTTYTDHSYRGYAADGPGRQLLLLNIDAETSIQHWCLMNDKGTTLKNGQITFPIRACYPQVALQDGAAHVLAIGDIVEPVEEWRAYKFEQTQRKWDYVFRVLYYTSTPDIHNAAFAPPIEIANLDASAGAISNQDLRIAPDGSAYILYTQTEVQSALMRDKFFPGKSITPSLRLAVVKDGHVVSRRVLVEGTADCMATWARFQTTRKGKVYAVVYFTGKENYNALMPICPESDAPLLRIPFKTPFSSFCLATVRAGNTPSRTFDLLGYRDKSDTLCYGQVLIKE